MSLSDNIWNGLTGHNVHTIKVSAEQLAAVINDAFIKNASSTEELNRIERTVRGSKLIFRRMDSEDGRFHLYVSSFEQGLTQHRYAFVKNYETEEVFEWNGFNLSPLRNAVEPYLLHARMNPPATPGTFTPFGFSDNNDDDNRLYEKRAFQPLIPIRFSHFICFLREIPALRILHLHTVIFLHLRDYTSPFYGFKYFLCFINIFPIDKKSSHTFWSIPFL